MDEFEEYCKGNCKDFENRRCAECDTYCILMKMMVL